MDINYYSAKDREALDAVMQFEGNFYEDSDIMIDVVGVVNLNPPIELAEGEEDTRPPVWSDFLFNVVFYTERYKEAFSMFSNEKPKTPIRTFFM